MNKPKLLRTWIEIDKRHIRHNYSLFRSLIPQNCKLMAIVKSNAYGHNLEDFSVTIEKLGADWLGVDSITEALALRKINIKIPILVLGFTLPDRIREASKNSISLTISNFHSLNFLKKLTAPLLIHLKVDTGMHRQGFLPEGIPQVLKIIKQLDSKVKLGGLYTHFASAKNPEKSEETTKQIEQFKKVASLIEGAGFRPIKHAAATGGTIVYPNSHFDMVRIGIGLYGMWPSPDIKTAFQKKFNLEPILSWKTIISEIKRLPSGSKIGYDGTETLKKEGVVAICPIGYWHGFSRNLSRKADVLVKGQRCKVLGRVAMDMIVIDVSDVKQVKIGEAVTLIGKDGVEEVTAEELANISGTINYEITTRLNPLIKRFCA